MYVYDQAHALAKAIRESEEYRLLRAKKEKVEEDPDLKKMLTDYRTKQLEIQKAQVLGRQVPEEAVQALRQMHDIVTANATLREFLEAENRFGTIIADIQKILLDGLDLQ